LITATNCASTSRKTVPKAICGAPAHPATLRQYAATLRAGAVLRLYQPVAEKIKRHVLISASADRTLAFLINTQPSPFIRRQAELLHRQVLTAKSTHQFMQHDSYIACHDTVSLVLFYQLAAGLHVGSIERLGAVEISLFTQIATAANGSRLIALRDAELIKAAFAVS
jgi:hypothetical protein